MNLQLTNEKWKVFFKNIFYNKWSYQFCKIANFSIERGRKCLNYKLLIHFIKLIYLNFKQKNINFICDFVKIHNPKNINIQKKMI